MLFRTYMAMPFLPELMHLKYDLYPLKLTKEGKGRLFFDLYSTHIYYHNHLYHYYDLYCYLVIVLLLS